MLDIKHIDEKKHMELTGKSNQEILSFARYLDKKNKKIWLRYVLVPGINDDEKTLIQWKQFSRSLVNVEKIEVLPYHKLGIEKYKKLGINYRFADVKEPTLEQIAFARQILEK